MPNLSIIKDILAERNIPLAEFCQAIHMSVPGFKQILARNSTRIQTLELIAETLNCPVGVFFKEVQTQLPGEAPKLKPHIPISAQAGSLSELSEGVATSACEMNAQIESLGSYDFTIDVHGDSMLPEFRSGDVVACKRLYPGDPIHYGSIYVLDTVQGVVMKKVEKYPVDNQIQCISLNPIYQPFQIALEDIYGMSRVIGSIKSF